MAMGTNKVYRWADSIDMLKDGRTVRVTWATVPIDFKQSSGRGWGVFVADGFVFRRLKLSSGGIATLTEFRELESPSTRDTPLLKDAR